MYVDPATGQRYVVDADGTTRWIEPDPPQTAMAAWGTAPIIDTPTTAIRLQPAPQLSQVHESTVRVADAPQQPAFGTRQMTVQPGVIPTQHHPSDPGQVPAVHRIVELAASNAQSPATESRTPQPAAEADAAGAVGAANASATPTASTPEAAAIQAPPAKSPAERLRAWFSSDSADPRPWKPATQPPTTPSLPPAQAAPVVPEAADSDDEALTTATRFPTTTQPQQVDPVVSDPATTAEASAAEPPAVPTMAAPTTSDSLTPAAGPEPTDLEPSEVKLDHHPADLNPAVAEHVSIVSTDLKSNDIEPKDVEPIDLAPVDLEPATTHVSPHSNAHRSSIEGKIGSGDIRVPRQSAHLSPELPAPARPPLRWIPRPQPLDASQALERIPQQSTPTPEPEATATAPAWGTEIPTDVADTDPGRIPTGSQHSDFDAHADTPPNTTAGSAATWGISAYTGSVLVPAPVDQPYPGLPAEPVSAPQPARTSAWQPPARASNAVSDDEPGAQLTVQPVIMPALAAASPTQRDHRRPSHTHSSHLDTTLSTRGSSTRPISDGRMPANHRRRTATVVSAVLIAIGGGAAIALRTKDAINAPSATSVASAPSMSSQRPTSRTPEPQRSAITGAPAGEMVADAALRFEVLSTRSTSAVGRITPTKTTDRFVIVRVRIHNAATSELTIDPGIQTLYDNLRTPYQADVTLSQAASSSWSRPLGPNRRMTAELVFEVPSTVTPRHLKLRQSPTTPGTITTLR